jgi:hypothetical protein
MTRSRNAAKAAVFSTDDFALALKKAPAISIPRQAPPQVEFEI